MIIKANKEVKCQGELIIVCADFDTEKDFFLLGIPKGLSGKDNMRFYLKTKLEI